MRKLTYEYVRDYFKEQGCEMLDEEYINNKTRIKYKCNCGDVSRIRFTDFKEGRRCKKCGNNKNSESQKLSYDYVSQFFTNRGCELLEHNYINNLVKMRYRCSCGNISTIRFSEFHAGAKRRKCSGCEKYTYEYMKKFFSDRNCELLETSYKDVFEKMRFKCSCGNVSQIRFISFKRGCKCVECGAKKRSGKSHYKWIENRKAMKENAQFRQRCRSMLRMVLNKIGQKKKNKTSMLLGYSIDSLQNHIHNHSNWKNIKNKKYHIDHIFPIKAFLDYSIKDIKLINCFENLQPLEAVKNLRKSDQYDMGEFEIWLKKKEVKF